MILYQPYKVTHYYFSTSKEEIDFDKSYAAELRFKVKSGSSETRIYKRKRQLQTRKSTGEKKKKKSFIEKLEKLHNGKWVKQKKKVMPHIGNAWATIKKSGNEWGMQR